MPLGTAFELLSGDYEFVVSGMYLRFEIETLQVSLQIQRSGLEAAHMNRDSLGCGPLVTMPNAAEMDHVKLGRLDQ